MYVYINIYLLIHTRIFLGDISLDIDLNLVTEYLKIDGIVSNIYVCAPRISRFLRFDKEYDIISPFDVNLKLQSNDPKNISLPKIVGSLSLEKGINILISQVWSIYMRIHIHTLIFSYMYTYEFIYQSKVDRTFRIIQAWLRVLVSSPFIRNLGYVYLRIRVCIYVYVYTHSYE